MAILIDGEACTGPIVTRDKFFSRISRHADGSGKEIVSPMRGGALKTYH